MRKFRTLIRIAAFFLMIPILSGCGKPEDDTASPPQRHPELKVVTSYGGTDGNRRHFEEALELYERRTGVTVDDNSGTANEKWKAKVMADFETASEPDVLFFFTDSVTDSLINAGKLVSIEEIREVYPEYAANMKDSMLAVAGDGKHYAVPSYGYWENLFVNRAVLGACGVDMPDADYTWDEFLRDCEQIRSCGYVPISGSLGQFPHYWFEFVVMNNGSVEDHLDIPQLGENGVLIKNAAAMKWLNALHDLELLYSRGFFPGDTMTSDETEVSTAFAEGKAAFMLEGSWMVSWLESYYPDRINDYAVTFVPAKGERLPTQIVGGLSMGYFITRKAWDDPEKRQAAVAFVELLTSEEVLGTFVTTEITALKDGISQEGFSPLQQSAAENNAGITDVTGAVQDTIPAMMRSTLFANIQYVVTDKMSAEEAITEALRVK